MKQSQFRLIAVFFLSVASIAFEISVMRTFSVGSWSNFGSMVISIALLGYGLAGTLITFLQEKIRKKPNTWLSVSAVLLMPSMALSHVFAQLIPFNPVMIVSDPSQFLWIGAYYIVYSIPFFIGAIFIGVAFICLSSRIRQLYFWNMVGSGIGGFVILGCMYVIPPDYLVIPILVISLIASILCFIRYDSTDKKISIDPKALIIPLCLFVISAGAVVFFGKISVSEYKMISYARKFPDAKLDTHSYSPTGEIHVYSSSYFHAAPGLSDNAVFYVEKMPNKAFKGLYVDGGGPIEIQRKLTREEEKYLDFLPMAAPYLLTRNPKVMLVKLGGGTSIFTALYNDAQSVTAVEPDPAIVNLIGDVPSITKFNDNLLRNKKVRVVAGEPRAFCATTPEKFDILEISLIDSVGLSQTGGYPVNENYTYTVEALRDYMRCLNDNGILSITLWNRLTPPRNVPKLLTTVVKSLEVQNMTNPGDQIFVFDLLLSTATVLVKKTPFTADETTKLIAFCKRMSFEPCYYPGMPTRAKDFDKILAAYTDQYKRRPDRSPEARDKTVSVTTTGGTGARSAGPEISKTEETPELLPSDLYHFFVKWLLAKRADELYSKYVFDVRPATDDRPYYTAYMKPHTIPMFMSQLGEVSEEWGYLILLGTLGQSILFGILIIIIPLSARWRDLFKGRRGTFGVIVYYACLGLAYMLVEIFLIQKLVFFLEDPIFSTSIVITCLLVISGLGSVFSNRFAVKPAFGVKLAAAGICLSLIFYMFGLSPCLNVLLGLPFLAKVLISIVLIAPSAFFMGMPFPTGLSTLSASRERLIPWAWGMNGALSVTGSVIAKLISISTGFFWVLLLAGVLYVIAALIFRANERRDPIASTIAEADKDVDLGADIV
jgi:hypothetical protein